MYRRILACAALVCALSIACGVRPAPAAAATKINHVIYLMMENQGFDDVVGHDAPGSAAPYTMDTPFITYLATTFGLETLTFGTTHPSLPNYLSLVAGNYFGIQDDNPSCYAVPKQSTCDKVSGMTIADTLEAKKMTWKVLEQSMPSVGYLGPQYPTSSTGPELYAQKHNPFVYFKQIATNQSRLANILPFKSMSDLSTLLKSDATAPNFLFIVPDQCHDMHGTTTCAQYDKLLQEGDNYVKQVVTTIMHSGAWKPDTALIIAWDEDDYSSVLGCCGSKTDNGGGHTALIVITPKSNPKSPIQIATPSNHYNELASIETLLGLPKIGMSATQPATLLPLIP